MSRFHYDREESTVITGGKKRRKWMLGHIPPEVMYEWIREDKIFKGLFIDWLNSRRGNEDFQARIVKNLHHNKLSPNVISNITGLDINFVKKILTIMIVVLFSSPITVLSEAVSEAAISHDFKFSWIDPVNRTDGTPLNPDTEIKSYQLNCEGPESVTRYVDRSATIRSVENVGREYLWNDAVSESGVYDCKMTAIDTGDLESEWSSAATVAKFHPPDPPNNFRLGDYSVGQPHIPFIWDYNNQSKEEIHFRLYEDSKLVVDNIGEMNFVLLMEDKEHKEYTFYVTSVRTNYNLESDPSNSFTVDFVKPPSPENFRLDTPVDTTVEGFVG